MQFIDLQTQYKKIKNSMDERIQQVLQHGRFILGPEVEELETKLAHFSNTKHALGVGSGTEALQVAFMALDLQPGDEVITTPFTFIATVSMLVLLGIKPVFVDIDADTFNIDVGQIEDKITAKTKAILAVDLYGQCADYDAINQIAKKHDLIVIADSAQSYGATQNNIAVGNLAKVTCTSFYPAKPLGGYGEAGACFTNDPELDKKMRSIHNHGQEGTYNHVTLGLNARLDTLQAAILLAKLEVYEEEINLRSHVASKYDELLQGKIKTPNILSKNTSVYAQYTIRSQERDKLRQHLSDLNIPTAVHYPKPAHLQIGFKHLGYQEGDFPLSEQAAKEVLSLPMHPYLTDEQIETVAKAVLELNYEKVA